MNYRAELAEYAHFIEEKGYVDTYEGNISLFDREKNLLYITPTSTSKLHLTEGQIAVLDLSDSDKQVAGSKRASSEYRLHKSIYGIRKDCCAIVHSHAPYLTAYAMLGKNIKIDCTGMFTWVKGEIFCVPFGMFGTSEIANGLDKALSDRDMALLGNHGVVSIGENLESAFGLLESMENTVKSYCIAASIGKPVSIPNFESMI